MPKVLVVDDEPKILKIIEHSLRREGYDVITALDGSQAIEQFHRQEPELIILDLMLPHVDGFQVCRTVRETSSIPIIILSVRNEELDKILGFNLGVDDYLAKPFSPVELCLRVKAVLRRTRKEESTPTPDSSVFNSNGLYINPSTREVAINDQPVELTAKEFDMLWFLAKHPNKVFTRKQLLYQIWQADYYGNDDAVTVLISRLREKIELDKSQLFHIRTLRGVGYKLTIE
ncbi:MULTISPECIES: response regulator transcription factor [Desulfitobacterium]|uniref:Stage 0 sporulation protein A homolog n=1 Tax=Desulfitobacterium dehalogenans (strain ATCC 51507 / DSM 9161 / JW/IU-DC1) TaxID=756499 RepID=I4A5I3_DESDJ|nr:MULTISPECIES: response regulator transcription factor [Desulfitobacterium]AFL99217.1 response regulator with CheY-like receiver domain and winged-helix DNA-binding domain [Desulfitobacterium dehalogenans ATCC 51507]